MEPPAFLAFDLGASSGRGMHGELRDGRLGVSEFCRFPNGMISVLGHLHWNIYSLFEHIKEGLRLYAARMDRPPESVGIDTWGVDFGLLAPDGSLLGLPYGYRDRRTEGAMDSFFARIPSDRVYELTGIQFLPFNSLFQLEAMVRDRSPLLDSAADLLFIPDLLNYLLTGTKKTEFTFATTSQIYNPTKGNWEEELLSALGLPESLMQEIVPPGSVVAETLPEIVDSTGLPRIPIVAVATHDTGSAVAAVPAEGDGWAYISSGTWSLMGIEVGAPIISKESCELNFTNEGGVDGTFRFLKNIAGLWLLEECRRVWATERECRYEELLRSAESAEPFRSMIDPDRREFLNPPDMPDAIRSVCKATGQKTPASPGQFVRCILESLALKYRFVLDQVTHVSTTSINRIHVIGGGSRNRVLCQFTANATQLPVISGPAEATAIGNIMVQALSRGHVASLAEMREVIRRSFDCETYEPRQAREWDSAYDRFRDIIDSENRPD